MSLLFDLEANGLWKPTVVHCITIWDGENLCTYGPDTISTGVQRLATSKRICAHNGIMYDVPVIENLFNIKLPPCDDTLIWSRLLFPDVFKHPIGTKKPNSIEAYGDYFGIPKHEFDGPWEVCCDGMIERNRRDVEILRKVVEFLQPKLKTYSFPLALEHAVARQIRKQITNGVAFDMKAANDFERLLTTDRAVIHDSLQQIFPPQPLQLKTKVKWIPFNPNSRKQFAERMHDKYGYEIKYTDKGNVTCDNAELELMDWPEARQIEDLEIINDRLEKLLSWIAATRRFEDGRVHGWVNTIGCVTFRMSHSDPHLGQVPKVGKRYGIECRSCFVAGPGMVLVGADLSGVELRLLANRMWDYDNGDYARIVVEQDPHEYNRRVGEIDERWQAKNTIYALLYGAGDKRLARVSGKSDGRRLRRTLMQRIPALAKVTARCKEMGVRMGYVVLLDGRRAPIRKDYMALNTQIQGDAAVLHKLAYVLACNACKDMPVKWVLNVHDEQQIECPPDIAEEVGKILVDCMAEAGKILKVKVPITGEYKIGANWRETH